MTTPSPDEMKARELCRMIAPRVKSAPEIITQALSEKTEEIERLKLDVAHIARRCLNAEARLAEVVEECAETVKAHVMYGLDDYARGFREAIAVAAAAIRARFPTHNGGPDNG